MWAPTTSDSTGISLTIEIISDIVVDLDYFSFPNPSHLPKHEFVSPNNQF